MANLWNWEQLHTQHQSQATEEINESAASKSFADYPESWSQDVADLWIEQVVPRQVLAPWISAYPCSAFLKPVEQLVESGHRQIDWQAWMDWAPSLRNVWRELVSIRAKLFNDTEQALPYALLWAREFEGGRDAWLAFARAFKRAWRRQSNQDQDALHIFTQHFSLTHHEESPLRDAFSSICNQNEAEDILSAIFLAPA